MTDVSPTALAELRGEWRESFAVLAGKIDTLAASQSGDIAQLREKVDDVDHKRKGTDVTVSALHRRLDELPDARDWQRIERKVDTGPSEKDWQRLEAKVDQLAAQQTENRLSLAKLWAMMTGSAGVGGGVVLLLQQVLNQGGG